MKRLLWVASVLLLLAAGCSAKTDTLPSHRAYYGVGAFVAVDSGTDVGDVYYLNPGQDPRDYRDSAHNIMAVWYPGGSVAVTVMCGPLPVFTHADAAPDGWTGVTYYYPEPAALEHPCD